MRRTLLATIAAASCLAAPTIAQAAVPSVHASAYLVQDARTGEVLASYHAHAHLPVASITKLMTVLIALEHHKLTDVVTVDPRAAVVGESTINLGAGERITVSDLLKAALIQSANDAADALALSVASDYGAFAGLMNAKAAQFGLRDSHFVRPDGLDVPGEYSSAADATKLARIAMRTRFVARHGAPGDRDDRRGARPAHMGRPAHGVPADDRRQDRSHRGRRLVPGRGGPWTWDHHLCHLARWADPLGAERRSRVAARMGDLRVPRRATRAARPHVRERPASLRQGVARAPGGEAVRCRCARRPAR